MNPIDDPLLPFDGDASTREWLAQEQAMRRERLHLDTLGDDARTLRYRALARVLRQSPGDLLPPDFAERMAAKVGARPAHRRAADTRLEWGLMIALALAFVIAAGVVTRLYGSTWLAPLMALWPTPDPAALHWLLVLAGCLALSWLLGRLPGHAPLSG